MARWWRSSARKPSTSSGENDTPGTVTPEAEGGTATTAAAASRIKRTILRRGKKDETTTPPPPPPPTAAPNDPARPFTQQNLEHQRILGNFSWPAAAGGRKPSHGARSHASGVSPSTSRTTSVDDDAAAAAPRSPRSPPRAPADRRSRSGRLRRSLDAAPHEIPGGASPQGHVPTAVLPSSVSDAHRRA